MQKFSETGSSALINNSKLNKIYIYYITDLTHYCIIHFTKKCNNEVNAQIVSVHITNL